LHIIRKRASRVWSSVPPRRTEFIPFEPEKANGMNSRQDFCVFHGGVSLLETRDGHPACPLLTSRCPLSRNPRSVSLLAQPPRVPPGYSHAVSLLRSPPCPIAPY